MDRRRSRPWICLLIAWLTYKAHLSLALGAFFAGLIISESDYHHQATALVLPFREVFVSFFFVSVGMLFDFGFFAQNVVIVTSLVLAVLVINTAINTGIFTGKIIGTAFTDLGEQVGLSIEALETAITPTP